jgi:hypothetical protein
MMHARLETGQTQTNGENASYPKGSPVIIPADTAPIKTTRRAGERAQIAARLITGDCILDIPPVPPAVWGKGDDLLWAEGQSLIVAGPDGTGKTTLAGNLVQARLGTGTGHVLNLPVVPGKRNVLVLLMDRPRQAMAAYARLFAEDDRERLKERLVVWRGPRPKDLAKHPEILAELCQDASADTCVVDSLKDAATGLSEDEVGAGWNLARQMAIEEARCELLELTHPRKGQDGNRKPSKLDDLYGSRWIAAGAGSVLLLWGAAGDPVVELTHLKPVMAALGPWEVITDASTGLISVSHGVDLLDYVGNDGITATAAARVLFRSDKPTRSEVERARRKLEALRLAVPPLLVHRAGQRGRAEKSEARWFLAARGNHESNHGVLGGQVITRKSR